MALQLTITTPTGQEMENAYIKVQNITGTKDALNFNVFAYINSDKDQQPVEIKKDVIIGEGEDAQTIQGLFSIVPNLNANADNLIKQCYVALKALDQFDGAVDV